MGWGYTVRKSEYCFDPKRNGPKSKTPYTISRSKVDLFVECPRCFFLAERLGIKRPDSYPLSLNNAVDELMKREFDVLRKSQEVHPLMKQFGVDAVPYAHPALEEWRDALKRGIKYHDEDSHLILRGGIDDVWQDTKGDLHIVDYKATSKKDEVTLDAEWQDAYKRQVEVYQWLFSQNKFPVSPIAYFVYVNGNSDADRFDGKLEFSTTILSYEGNTKWIPPTLKKIQACLMNEEVPPAGADCSYCAYREIAGKTLLRRHQQAQHEKK